MSGKILFSLTQIEYVLAVQRYGHFAKAAQACHVTQPTLSMQIQKLEEDLATVIFDRSHKPILLTESGKKLIAQFQKVLFEAKRIAPLIEASKTAETQGQLIVGIIPTIAPYLLPLLLPQLASAFPKLRLNIRELQTHQIVDALHADEIDVGILATPLKMAKLHEYPLYYEPFLILCHRQHELAELKKISYGQLKAKDILADIWLLQEGHCLRQQVVDICSLKELQNEKRKFAFESGSLETLKNLINSYGGYTLLPTLANNSLGPATRLIPFDRPIPAREIGLVYVREHYKSELIECLGESILACIPESIRKIRQKDLDIIPVESS